MSIALVFTEDTMVLLNRLKASTEKSKLYFSWNRESTAQAEVHVRESRQVVRVTLQPGYPAARGPGKGAYHGACYARRPRQLPSPW